VKRLTRQLLIHANDRGSAAQRVAHYFLDALKARADGTGAQKYNMAAQVPAQVLSEDDLGTTAAACLRPSHVQAMEQSFKGF